MVVPFASLPHKTRLPLTEAVEGLVCVMIDGQAQLEMKGERNRVTELIHHQQVPTDD